MSYFSLRSLALECLATFDTCQYNMCTVTIGEARNPISVCPATSDKGQDYLLQSY